jgi:hypothetical protein
MIMKSGGQSMIRKLLIKTIMLLGGKRRPLWAKSSGIKGTFVERKISYSTEEEAIEYYAAILDSINPRTFN